MLQTADASARAALASIDPNAVDALVGTPLLRAAIHHHIAATFTLVSELDDFGFWLSRSRDRIALAALVAALSTRDIGATAAEFERLAQALGFASRGAAADFLARARAAGYIARLEAGRTAASQTVTLQLPLWRVIRRTVRHLYGSLALTWPELAPVARGDRASLRALGQYLLMGLMWRSAALRSGGAAPFARPAIRDAYANVAPFIARDTGLRFLFAMIEQQPVDSALLLDRASLSRRQLAARLGVSRIHINRLLAEIGAARMVTIEAPDSLQFSSALSDAVELLFAYAFQIMRGLAHALQQNSRIDQVGLARIDRAAVRD